MALGGWLPAADRGVYFPLLGVIPEARRNAAAIWRQKLCPSELLELVLQNFCNEIDWYYKACLEEHPRITARS